MVGRFYFGRAPMLLPTHLQPAQGVGLSALANQPHIPFRAQTNASIPHANAVHLI
jgi:hypothetical protein